MKNRQLHIDKLNRIYYLLESLLDKGFKGKINIDVYFTGTGIGGYDIYTQKSVDEQDIN